jgi:hypothetical protein
MADCLDAAGSERRQVPCCLDTKLERRFRGLLGDGQPVVQCGCEPRVP